jgi:hypothetical protein
MIPDPITSASRKAVPGNSAAQRGKATRAIRPPPVGSRVIAAPDVGGTGPDSAAGVMADSLLVGKVGRPADPINRVFWP